MICVSPGRQVDRRKPGLDPFGRVAREAFLTRVRLSPGFRFTRPSVLPGPVRGFVHIVSSA